MEAHAARLETGRTAVAACSRGAAASSRRSSSPRRSCSWRSSSASRSSGRSTSASPTRSAARFPATGSASTTSRTPGTTRTSGSALRNTLIFTLASQAIVVVGAAVLSNFLVRDFRGKWIIRFLVVLPWAAPVVLSHDHLALAPRLALQRAQLDARAAARGSRPRLAARRGAHRGRRAGAAAVARPPEPRAGRDHARARVADPALRRRHLHRRPRRRSRTRSRTRRRIDGATGFKKLWYVDLPLQLPIALVAVLFGIVFTAVDFAVVYILTHGRAVQLDAGAAHLGLRDRDRLGLARRGRRDLAVPLPAARAS